MKKGLVIAIVIFLIVVGVFAVIKLTTKTNQTTDSPEITSQENNSQEPEVTSPPEVSSGKVHEVRIKGSTFTPSLLNVKMGDTVKWTNWDSMSHTVTSDTGNELDSELLSKDGSYSHVFSVPGTYNYHCTPHPYMKARIIVEA